MFFLLLSILSSTILVMIFKFFPQFKINTFQAIVVNYIVCVLCGSLVLGRFPFDSLVILEEWFYPALILGFLFISGFYAVGMTVMHFGLTIASVLQKMSILISVPFAIYWLKEGTDTTKMIGMVLALAAVILTNWQDQKKEKIESGSQLWLWFFPAYAFLVSGAIECILQLTHMYFIHSAEDDAEFSSGLFASAGLIGLTILTIQILLGKQSLDMKSVGAGIALGIPNFFSIYFLLKTFQFWDKSIAIPLNNVSIVIVSALLGYFLFKEKLSNINALGVLIAIVSILLISGIVF